MMKMRKKRVVGVEEKDDRWKLNTVGLKSKFLSFF